MDKSRIDLLRRKQAGRAARAELKKRLSEVADLREGDWRLLGLEESDGIREAVKERFAPRYEDGKKLRDTIPFCAERQFPLGILPSLLSPVAGAHINVYVIFLDADIVGVLGMPEDTFRECWKDLVGLDTDGFVVVDAEFCNKLAIQVIGSGADQACLLDIGVWGSEWRDCVARMDC